MDVVGNLHAKLRLSIGCRIMLLENVWVERGLVNGSLGTLRDIQILKILGHSRH
jgi:ATP-dependent DNA helicase PIF1